MDRKRPRAGADGDEQMACGDHQRCAARRRCAAEQLLDKTVDGTADERNQAGGRRNCGKQDEPGRWAEVGRGEAVGRERSLERLLCDKEAERTDRELRNLPADAVVLRSSCEEESGDAPEAGWAPTDRGGQRERQQDEGCSREGGDDRCVPVEVRVLGVRRRERAVHRGVRCQRAQHDGWKPAGCRRHPGHTRCAPSELPAWRHVHNRSSLGSGERWVLRIAHRFTPGGFNSPGAAADQNSQMAAEDELVPDGPPPTGDGQGRTLFAYEAIHESRLVTRLVGIGSRGADVRVVAEVYPVHAPETSEPQWRFYDFPSPDRARRFADEALLALEYLGCSVSEPLPHASEATATIVTGAVAA